MLFSSSVFLMAFIPLTLLIYFAVPARFVNIRNAVLLFFSLIFYGWGEPKYILVMLISIFANYYMALKMEGKMKESKNGKVWLAADIGFNLSLLGFFKYAGIPGIALPIGISFYTFQTMSYVIDVYRGKVSVQRNIMMLATYISLFPQLIAGPIVRYSDVEHELKQRKSSPEMISEGIRRFIFGLSKKVLIANQVAIVWEEIRNLVLTGEEVSTMAAWIGAICYTFQIYFDFSGYSDMAIGLGKIFGFKFSENFNYPYISKSITEFWRRWHISLSSWFKEYVYIPLGGNRKGKARQILNISIVWALTGVWHGAGWNFLLWGLYYGLLLIIEKLFLLEFVKKMPGLIRTVYTMFFVVLGWVIFAIEDFGLMGKYIGIMFGSSECFFGWIDSYYSSTRFILIILAAFFSTPIAKNLVKNISGRTVKYEGGMRPGTDFIKAGAKPSSVIETVLLASLFVLCLAYLTSGSYNPFLYFRF